MSDTLGVDPSAVINDPEYQKLNKDQKKELLTRLGILQPQNGMLIPHPSTGIKVSGNLIPSNVPPGQPTPETDSKIQFLRPIVAGGAEALGSLGTPALGTAAGLGTDYLMQSLQTVPQQGVLSKTLGLNPGDPYDKLANSLEMAVGAKVAGAAMGKIISGVKGATTASGLDDLFKTYYEKAMGGNPVTRTLRTLAPGLSVKEGATINPDSAADAIQNDLSFKYGQASAANHPLAANGNLDGVRDIIQNQNSPNPVVDTLLKDRVKLKRALDLDQLQLPGGGIPGQTKENLRQYMAMKLLNDPATAAKTLTNPEMENSLGQLFSPSEKKRLASFAQNLQDSDVIKSIGHGWKFPITAGIAAGLAGHNLSAWEIGGAGIVGLKLAQGDVAKLMLNPLTSKFMANAFAAKPLGVSDEYAAKALGAVLEGSGMFVVTKDKKELPGTMNEGKLNPVSSN